MQALRSLLDQQAEDAQARLLRQRGQLVDSFGGLHESFRYFQNYGNILGVNARRGQGCFRLNGSG
jgi:hypothetical protein